MIISFRSLPLKALWQDNKAAKLPPDQIGRIRRLLDALNSATRIEDLSGVAAFRFHALHGNPHRYAMAVNGPWRITFGWDGSNATLVDHEQYH